MSYTVNPIPPIDSINNHSGFIGFTVVMVIFFILVWINNDEEFNMYKVFVLFSIPCAIAAAISWNTGTYSEYKNTKVEGKFIGFVAEGYNVDERSGKHTRRVDKHFTYVEYEIEGNRVLFRSTTGTVYPKIGVFYKN
jgi:hypothetical protein